MSAILSADDLNDFITPGTACIKPVEVLPALPQGYEVTQERETINDATANGLASRTKHGNHFTFVVDTNAMRNVALELGRGEVLAALENASSYVKKPVLTSACPGWVSTLIKKHDALINDPSTGLLC